MATFQDLNAGLLLILLRDQATESEPTQFVVYIFWPEILGPK